MIKRIFTNWRVIILIVFLVMSAIAIRPSPWHDGVTVRSVITNSTASEGGMLGPKGTMPPVTRERLLQINNIPIKTVSDFHTFEKTLEPNMTVLVETSKDSYRLLTRAIYKETVLNETENITVEKIITEEIEINGTNQTINKTINVTETVNKVHREIIGTQPLGIKVYENPTTNIRKGLDLQGGTRVVILPEGNVTTDMLDLIKQNMEQRLNVYGLSDIVIVTAHVPFGDSFIIVEIAGANEEEVKELLSKQGKFEAKIGAETVFIGGERDVTYVAMSSEGAGIDPYSGCSPSSEGYQCRFRFQISLSSASAERMQDITNSLDIVPSINTGSEYLNESIDLYLDNQLVDSLQIAADLKGQKETDIVISGSGVGRNEQEAIQNALTNMKRLQTIVATGSMPVKLNIVKTDTLSPTLGIEFISNSLWVGFFALFGVSIIIFFRYRKIGISIPMIITSAAELIIILGAAALLGWNLDLASIAGIIIVIGTGVDHLIVVTDEVLKKDKYSDKIFTWKTRIKNAFFIIMAAYFTTLVAMIPLFFAGAGLLKGFALTTIVGITIGVFITRPAFASIIEIVLKDN